MIHPRDQETNRFHIFEELNPDFIGDSLLDFGGNQGNLLYFSNGVIKEEKYTSVDVSKDSIDKGQYEFPNGNFVWWDRYNEMYNHEGSVGEILPKCGQHDYVWAYSVFSHMVYEDILEVLIWMKSIGAKRILVSYLCNDHDENSNKVMEYFYQRRLDKYTKSVDFRSNCDDYFYLTDNAYGVSSGETFIAVYKTNWLISKLKSNGIIAKKVNSLNTPIPFLEISYEN